MLINYADALRAGFQNCLDRNVAPDQLQAYVDRARTHWAGDAEMLAVVEGLQNQI